MYLLTFTFLLISLLGIYTQAFAVRTAQMFANQSAVGQLMFDWHNGALGLANVTANFTGLQSHAYGQAGCSLTVNLVPAPATPPQACKDAGGNPLQMTTSNDQTQLTASHLPFGYNAANYQWNSIFYQIPAIGGHYYVVTYLPPPASGSSSDPIYTPPIGTGTGNVLKQLGLVHVPLVAYGGVKTGIITTLVGFAYPAPLPLGVIPDGSVAIISQVSGDGP